MNYLVAKKALRDTMSAEDYTETIDFSELIDMQSRFTSHNLMLGEEELSMHSVVYSNDLLHNDLHTDMILLGYTPA